MLCLNKLLNTIKLLGYLVGPPMAHNNKQAPSNCYPKDIKK